MTTSLLGVALVSAQPQVTATSGIARDVTLPDSHVHAPSSAKSLKVPERGTAPVIDPVNPRPLS